MVGFNKAELKILKRLNRPAKIQDFLETLRANFERRGETCYSPRLVLRYRKAQCLEGAMFAAAALRLLGFKPLIMELKVMRADLDHVIAPFKLGGRWGALSKTNHAVLRYREPVYKTLRELVMSYFHEYFLDNGQKTLRSFSQPLDLSRFDKLDWMTSEKPLWYVDRALNQLPHYPVLPKPLTQKLRRADPLEIRAGRLAQWRR